MGVEVAEKGGKTKMLAEGAGADAGNPWESSDSRGSGETQSFPVRVRTNRDLSPAALAVGSQPGQI